MAKKRVPTELEAVYVISVAASLAGMHPQTLRIYERRGLIEPFRTPGGTRRYSNADLERLALIQDLTSQGINIEGCDAGCPAHPSDRDTRTPRCDATPRSTGLRPEQGSNQTNTWPRKGIPEGQLLTERITVDSYTFLHFVLRIYYI